MCILQYLSVSEFLSSWGLLKGRAYFIFMLLQASPSGE